ncbi:MAG TPA: hypothetical protein VLB85_06440 [Acidimicrobiia bacterium]|nr:hypothetical protein [Acidimicrobiia bacterium]
MSTDPHLPDSDQDPDDRIPPAPWSFRIMVALAVLYLAWRLIQGLVWLVERII